MFTKNNNIVKIEYVIVKYLDVNNYFYLNLLIRESNNITKLKSNNLKAQMKYKKT